MNIINKMFEQAMERIEKNAVDPMACIFITTCKCADGTISILAQAAKHKDIDDAEDLFLHMGMFMCELENDNTRAFVNGVINAIDAPLKDAMKGGAE